MHKYNTFSINSNQKKNFAFALQIYSLENHEIPIPFIVMPERRFDS